jgi:1-deoxy-D-xylulose-5-phosphate synthase
MTVLAPSSYEEVGEMLATALEITAGPVAIRWPKSDARSVPALARRPDSDTGSVPRVNPALAARKLRAGSDVCLLGVGKLVAACEEAATLLALRGIEATVWDVRVATPLDVTMIEDAWRHRIVVTAEDGITDGGVGSLIAGAIRAAGAAGAIRAAGAGSDSVRAGPQVVNCGVPTTYIAHGRAGDILADLGLDGPGLNRTVLDTIARHGL